MKKKYVEKSPKNLRKVREEKFVSQAVKRITAAKIAKPNTFDRFVFEQVSLLRAFESATAKASRKVVRKYAFELAFAWWRLTDLISRHSPGDDTFRVTPPLPLPRRVDLASLRGAGRQLISKLGVRNARKEGVSIFAPSDAYVQIGFKTNNFSKPTLVNQPPDFKTERDPPKSERAKSKRMN